MFRAKLWAYVFGSAFLVPSVWYFCHRHHHHHRHHEAAVNVTGVFCEGNTTALTFDFVKLSHIDSDDNPVVTIPNPPDSTTVAAVSVTNNVISVLPVTGATSPIIFEYQLDWQEDTHRHHVTTITPETQTAQVTVYIRSANSAPPTAADFPNATIGVSDTLYIDVLAAATSSGPGKIKLTINTPSTPTGGGTATIAGNSIKYVAPSSPVVDTFTYTLSDECGNISNTATVTVNVTSPGSGASAGTRQKAQNVTGVFCGSNLEIDLLKCSYIDSDDNPVVTLPNNPDPTNITVVSNKIEISSAWAPTTSPVIFEYQLNWTKHGTAMSQTAQVTIYVPSISGPPTAADFPNETVGDGGTLLIDVLAAASTPGAGNRKLTINLSSTTSDQGNAISVSGSAIKYVAPTPAVSDSFTYTLSDECSNVSNTATVTINANLASTGATPAVAAVTPPPAKVLLVNHSKFEISIKIGSFSDVLQPHGLTVVPASVASGANQTVTAEAYLPRHKEPRKTTATVSLDPDVQYTITYTDDNVNSATITHSP